VIVPACCAEATNAQKSMPALSTNPLGVFPDRVVRTTTS
jgi:hypothetical protein